MASPRLPFVCPRSRIGDPDFSRGAGGSLPAQDEGVTGFAVRQGCDLCRLPRLLHVLGSLSCLSSGKACTRRAALLPRSGRPWFQPSTQPALLIPRGPAPPLAARSPTHQLWSPVPVCLFPFRTPGGLLSGSPLSSKSSPPPSATLFLALDSDFWKGIFMRFHLTCPPSFPKVTGDCHFSKPRDICQAV